MSGRSPGFYIGLSVATSLVTIVLKFGAYFLTGSVGLLSDALESFVNLGAALVAAVTLSYAHSGEDEDHNFGHEKAEYFSSGIEGALIFVAAAAIIWSASTARSRWRPTRTTCSRTSGRPRASSPPWRWCTSPAGSSSTR